MSNPIRLEVTSFEDKKGEQHEYTNRVEAVLDGVSKQGAQMVLRDTIALVPRGGKWPNEAGPLADEIRIEQGKFGSMDYYIRAQGPDNYSRYYASFVELGTKAHGEKQPYLRPALEKNRKKIAHMAQRALR